MVVVAGLSLRNLHPRVWDSSSDYFLPELKAVMVSFADVMTSGAFKGRAEDSGINASLGGDPDLSVYLDNGAFAFHRRGCEAPIEQYCEFAAKAAPDWKPIPHDFIPHPSMSSKETRLCVKRTMDINRRYSHDGYVPVLHLCRLTSLYIEQFNEHVGLSAKTRVALGGIVPNLLRARKAPDINQVVNDLVSTRKAFAGKELHVFGIGGTATLHIAALAGVNSVDSSGWRNRAARGIIQLPGTGERMVAELGSWRGRELSESEKKILRDCSCPGCLDGLEGLRRHGKEGFCRRAVHNLHVLLEEQRWISSRLADGTYEDEIGGRLDNSIYKPLVLALAKSRSVPG